MGLVKRVFNYWNAELTAADLSFIHSFLDEPGQFLFFQMSRIDQLHALSVARIIFEEAADLSQRDKIQAVKAALLHDIGKVDGDFSFWSRILVGFIRRIQPTLRGRFARYHRHSVWGKVRYSFYVDLVHPARGAHMAKIFGIDATVVEIIRRHHDPLRAEGNTPLSWLQLADNRN